MHYRREDGRPTLIWMSGQGKTTVNSSDLMVCGRGQQVQSLIQTLHATRRRLALADTNLGLEIELQTPGASE